MANWESKTLADTQFLAGLNAATEPALLQLQTALTLVGEGSKIAKLFLTGVANPAAAVLGLLADSIITQLRAYQESGWFFLCVDPTSAAYGMKKLADNFGYEMYTDNNGKANFVGCPAGWSCNDLAKAIFEELGIAGNIDYQAGEYDPSIADVIARYKNGQPVFYYMWTPNYVASAIPLGTESVWLNSKYNTSGGSAETKDEWGCVTNPCYLVVVNDVVAVVNPVFAKENARVIKLLEQLQIPIADIVALAGKVYNESLSKDDVNELAKAWIANNRETVDQWLSNVGND